MTALGRAGRWIVLLFALAVAVLQRLQSALMQEKLEDLRQAVEIEYKDPAWVQ